MSLEWLGVKSILGLDRWVWVLIAIAVLSAAIGIFKIHEHNLAVTTYRLGATTAVNNGLRETQKRTEDANDALEKLRAPGSAGDAARYAQCVRSSRTGPTACRRFLPQQSPDNGGASSSAGGQ